MNVSARSGPRSAAGFAILAILAILAMLVAPIKAYATSGFNVGLKLTSHNSSACVPAGQEIAFQADFTGAPDAAVVVMLQSTDGFKFTRTATATNGTGSTTFGLMPFVIDETLTSVTYTVTATSAGSSATSNSVTITKCVAPPADADKDGVPDSTDKCPGTPAGETVDANGCSASQRDSDGDGVSDATDKCPNVAGPASNAGCPVTPPTSGDIVWGKQGRDKASPSCLPGQATEFHFVLSGGGKISNAGTGTGTFSPSGTDSAAGDIKGAGGAAHYYVGGDYNSTVTDFVVSGATWVGDKPFLKLSDSGCVGDALPEPVVPTAPTQVDKCEPASGVTSDGVNIPADEHFTYTLDGKAATAGFHSVTGTSATVKATPKEGVRVKEGAKLTWDFTFTKVKCEVPPPVVENWSASVADVVCNLSNGYSKITVVNSKASTKDVVLTVKVDGQVVKPEGLEGNWTVAPDKTDTQTVRISAGEHVVTVLDQNGKVLVTKTVTSKCAPPPTGDKEFTVVWGSQQCVPGPKNDTFGAPVITPKGAATVHPGAPWVGNPASYSLMVRPNDGWKPAPGTELSKTYTDDGSNCGTKPPPPPPVDACPNLPGTQPAGTDCTPTAPVNHTVPGSGAPKTGGGGSSPVNTVLAGSVLLLGLGLALGTRRRKTVRA
jgi:hypothetical protein